MGSRISAHRLGKPQTKSRFLTAEAVRNDIVIDSIFKEMSFRVAFLRGTCFSIKPKQIFPQAISQVRVMFITAGQKENTVQT
ncbi:MAG: hypothetical protein DMG93_21430 [Acidobacteria bacterium]|nr:MAG: hypothetical protein DMG93_21430 [Acidobacteriota bacterium]